MSYVGWPDDLKNSPSFQKVAQASYNPNNAKISISKLILKDQNIYIKPLLELYSTYNKLCFETAYLGKNIINLLKQKVAQNVAISVGYFLKSWWASKNAQ